MTTTKTDLTTTKKCINAIRYMRKGWRLWNTNKIDAKICQRHLIGSPVPNWNDILLCQP